MKKIAISLILIILMATIAPMAVAEDAELAKKQSLRLFNFETETDISFVDASALDLPLLPNSSIDLEVKIKFKFETPSLFPALLLGTKLGNWIMFRDGKANMSVELDIIKESPSFCTLSFEDKLLIENISTDFQEVKAKLTIKVKESAKALESGSIKLKANFTPDENWGLMESGDELEKKITVDYVGDLEATIENDTMKIAPTKTVYIPINITNKFNGETTVKTNVKSIPKNWTIAFNESEINLGIDETKEIYLSVNSTKEFDNETITVEFSPVLKDNATQVGEKFSLEITLQNDGSLEDEGKLEIDITILIIILLIILIAVAMFWFLFKRR